MAKEDTAPADEMDVAETKSAPKKIEAPITGARLVRLPRDGASYPAAIYRGTQPAKGTKLLLTLANGVTYAGIVRDVTEADGEVLVEFRDGLKPEKV